MKPIRVIDIFAGPGGLGEGFSAYSTAPGQYPFKIALSIEKDVTAHQTLELRAFFRHFHHTRVPDSYYRLLRGEIPREQFLQRLTASSNRQESTAARGALREAWLMELGRTTSDRVSDRIAESVDTDQPWILIGGPPCQAYSLVGRSRNKGNSSYVPAKDKRQTLYVEYLQVLADHAPAVFIMENVKGLLSARLQHQVLFSRMLEDLEDPQTAIRREGRKVRAGAPRAHYRIRPVVCPRSNPTLFGTLSPADFLVRSELFGIPQARHRVILLGVRTDLRDCHSFLIPRSKQTPAKDVLARLPKVRSGLSGRQDSRDAWVGSITRAAGSSWLRQLRSDNRKVYEAVDAALERLETARLDRGGEFIPTDSASAVLDPDWFLDRRLGGVANHSTRGHMEADLQRYLFISAFGESEQRSPSLSEFPKPLLPAHANVRAALEGGYFDDRFRVQVRSRPATTITSHISKDGHYYVHYDPAQCRSLTVREAARLQTFPDNYFFCGGRTTQYQQVGNAVPPLLARQIAHVVYEILTSN